MPISLKNLAGWLPAILLFVGVLLWEPFPEQVSANRVLAIGLAMIWLWVSEVTPMPVVALLPLVLFPLLKICGIEEAAAPYANPVVFLFLGGFLIGLAIEKWNLHTRIALTIVKFTGTSGNRIVLGFILAAGLLSMWLSNTATTIMMYPIALSVIHVMEKSYKGPGKPHYLAICLLMSIAYASNFGGIATIIGTPPNVAFIAFIEKKYGFTYPFLDWMLLCMPIALLLMWTLYIVLTKVLYRNGMKSHPETDAFIQEQVRALGPLSPNERKVLYVFVGTAFLWIFRDVINNLQTVIKLDDTLIAMAGGLSLFIIPSSKEKEQLLIWKDTEKMAWGILLLFGGGISLANQLEKAGLIEIAGKWMASSAGDNLFLLVFLIAVASIFISEIMSNVAQVIVFAPVIAGMADVMQINPLLLGVPLTLGASCASMLPMGTPPNAIVFASGRLRLSDMLKTGLVMNLIAIVLITLFSYYLLPVITSSWPST